MHACYDQPGTRDTYIGTRVSQGWEMAGLVRQAAALGRHVISVSFPSRTSATAMGDLVFSASHTHDFVPSLAKLENL